MQLRLDHLSSNNGPTYGRMTKSKKKSLKVLSTVLAPDFTGTFGKDEDEMEVKSCFLTVDRM